MLRRARRDDPVKFGKLQRTLPCRRRLKASLPRDLYRIRDRFLDVTIRPDHHIQVDLSVFRNPLFWRYLSESGGEFGLAVTDRKLIFNFRVPHDQPLVAESAGIDLNMPSADLATSDGIVDSVDLREITRIQGAMARKRERIQRTTRLDQRAQRRVLRRYDTRERNRVKPLLHRAANELLRRVGNRNVIFEDLTDTIHDVLNGRKLRQKSRRDGEGRRRLSAWTHGQLQRIVSYKARTAVVRVNPGGTSSTCPQCGGALHHPSWRRSDCGNCQGAWHRDRAAAIVILDRGLDVLRGAAPPPSARNALLEAASWRPEVDEKSTTPGPATTPMNEDDAKDFRSVKPHRFEEEQLASGSVRGESQSYIFLGGRGPEKVGHTRI
jgi:putative transposase